MSEANSAYADLEKRFQRVWAVENAISILDWGQATMMPAGSAAARANVLAEVCSYVHELVSDPAVADLVSEAKSKGGLNEWQTANLREISHLAPSCHSPPRRLHRANDTCSHRARNGVARSAPCE